LLYFYNHQGTRDKGTKDNQSTITEPHKIWHMGLKYNQTEHSTSLTPVLNVSAGITKMP